jgi:hypothetical protein
LKPLADKGFFFGYLRGVGWAEFADFSTALFMMRLNSFGRNDDSLFRREIKVDVPCVGRKNKGEYRDPSPFDFAQGQDDDLKGTRFGYIYLGFALEENKQEQRQIQGFFAALRMTTFVFTPVLEMFLLLCLKFTPVLEKCPRCLQMTHGRRG